ncbi:hypothetical protein [Gordoniibacillus kamchatkensis]|uniref:hypothetical protein n=1 Tax=Gordoniibacillus kamchatkensis TaxID=1590651 RepID=UPI0012E0008C|nr:hypothetical protein [Paenibacillus sp. VKM B-2647]
MYSGTRETNETNDTQFDEFYVYEFLKLPLNVQETKEKDAVLKLLKGWIDNEG